MSFTFISFPPVRFPYRFKGGPGVCPHMPFGLAAQLPMPFPGQEGKRCGCTLHPGPGTNGARSAGFLPVLYHVYFLVTNIFRDFPKKVSGNAASRRHLLWEKTSVPREVSVQSRRMYTHRRHFAPYVLPRWQAAVFLKKAEDLAENMEPGVFGLIRIRTTGSCRTG